MPEKCLPEALRLPEDRVTDLMREQLGAYGDHIDRHDMEDDKLHQVAGGLLQVALAHASRAYGWTDEAVTTDIQLAQAAIMETAGYDEQRAARIAHAFALYHAAKVLAHTLPKSDYDIPASFPPDPEEDN